MFSWCLVNPSDFSTVKIVNNDTVHVPVTGLESNTWYLVSAALENKVGDRTLFTEPVKMQTGRECPRWLCVSLHPLPPFI